jgi:hypothetical protein
VELESYSRRTYHVTDERKYEEKANSLRCRDIISKHFNTETAAQADEMTKLG